MKKFIVNCCCILISIFTTLSKGQDNDLASSVLTPVAYQTGVPDISFPMVSLQAAKDFTLNFGLVYNANTYTPPGYSGRLGRNWMLTGSNFMVTRKIMGSYPDETLPSHMEWDDIYFYNLNGEHGSFRFERIVTSPYNQIINLIKLTPNNLEIIYNSQDRFFTIIDSKGYKYYFQNHDYHWVQKPTSDPAMASMTKAINTFYITKIEEPSGRTIAVFQNKLYIKNSVLGQLQEQLYIPEVITTDYGKILIEHIEDSNSWSFQDRFYFKNFTVKNHKNDFITKYLLEFTNSSYKYFDPDLFLTLEPQTIKVRYLKEIRKLDNNLNTIENTRFGYPYLPPAFPAWESMLPPNSYQKDSFLMNGLLKYVWLPSGGRVEYRYGKHTLKLATPIDYNDSAHTNQITNVEFEGYEPFSYKKKTDSIPFDSHDTKIYYLNNLQKSPKSRIYVKFFKDEVYPWGGNPENPSLGPGNPDPKLAYKVKNYTNYDPTYGGEIEDLYAPRAYVVPSDGSAYLEITGSGGNGWFEIYEKFWSDPPYTILNSTISNSGVKIEEIRYFDTIAQYNNNLPSKTINFDYDLLAETGVSSGVIVPDDQKEAIIYKNVKVTESDKPGYTTYSYKTSLDYPHYPSPNEPKPIEVWPNYNITKKGLIEKKEVINSNNVKVQSSNITYTLPTHDPLNQYLYEIVCESCDVNGFFLPSSYIYTQESFPEMVKTYDSSYDSQGNSISSTTERTYHQSNNNLLSEKTTTADGQIMETTYKYAAEMNNTKLLSVGMTSTPLEVTKKVNGIETGRIETKYEHAGNYYPSSVTTYGIGGVKVSEERNDVYDGMGNVLQSTTKTGIPTAYIYGYNSTLLIAKIEGLKYSEVMAIMGQPNTPDAYKALEIYTQSNLDIDDTSEEVLRQKLDAFRLKPAFKDYQITTYTYDPLIGIKSVTSPSGNKEYYYYDASNRLIRVEDINHNIIKEYKYSPYYEGIH